MMARVLLVLVLVLPACLHDWDSLPRPRVDVVSPAGDEYTANTDAGVELPDRGRDEYDASTADAIAAADVSFVGDTRESDVDVREPDVEISTPDAVDVPRVDVPPSVDASAVDVPRIDPGSPGAPCTASSECNRAGANCCAMPARVCACLQFGSCAPAFCP